MGLEKRERARQFMPSPPYFSMAEETTPGRPGRELIRARPCPRWLLPTSRLPSRWSSQLRHAFLHLGGCSFDEVLRFLEAEAGNDFADGLDDVDLVVAEGLEDDGEFVLFGGGGASARIATGGGSACAGHHHWCGGGDAEFFFNRLVQVAEVEKGHALQEFEYFFYLGCHVCSFRGVWRGLGCFAGCFELCGARFDQANEVPLSRLHEGREAVERALSLGHEVAEHLFLGRKVRD